MVRVGLAGLGKMGLSHLAIFRAHPDVEVAAVCDPTGYVRSVLGKYTGLVTTASMEAMVEVADLDAVVIATPTHMHSDMVGAALERGLHVFCEKPFCLDVADAERLAQLARDRELVTQVGYHNRYVGAFAEAKRLVEAGAIGRLTHVLAEAYGPVVLKEQGTTWRSRKAAGGGCLYDYAAHPLNLVNWYLGEPRFATGSVLNRVFSAETDDEVLTTLRYDDQVSAQVSVSWSDESQRKMTTRLTLWGTQGRIFVDRQEIQVYLRDTASVPQGYRTGWNVKYTTELTDPVWFYLRGEEYSAQVADFVDRIGQGRVEGVNDFASAAVTDRTIAKLVDDATGASVPRPPVVVDTGRRRRLRLPRWLDRTRKAAAA